MADQVTDYMHTSPMTGNSTVTDYNSARVDPETYRKSLVEGDKFSAMLEVPLTGWDPKSLVPSAKDQGPTTDEQSEILAELEEVASRIHKRPVKKNGFKNFCRYLFMNLFDCLSIPDEIPEMGKLTRKQKAQYVMQSRGVFWWTLFLLVVTVIIFSWELNDQTWGSLMTTVLCFQIVVNTLFLVEVCLRWWLTGTKAYFTNPWSALDFVIVAVAMFGVIFCAIILFDQMAVSWGIVVCNIRHLILLRLITVVQRLSEDDLRLRGGTSVSEVAVSGMHIGSHDIRIGRRLGAGAFAEVFLGLYSGSLVAVKVLHQSEADNVDAFYKEANILTLLRHPNIVLFMGVVDEPEKLWFVTEYCARGSLHTVIKDRKLFRPGVISQLTLRIGIDIARGMTYLHGHKRPILHRDLKTANVLVSNALEAKVADFGESTIRSQVQKESPVVGTVQYTAPEVLRAESYAAPADIYSLGVVLWELATLEVPFARKNPVHVGYSVAFQGLRPDIESVPLEYAQKDISGSSGWDGSLVSHSEPSVRKTTTLLGRYRELILSCWDEDPMARPTASMVLKELEQLLHMAGCMVATLDEGLSGPESKGFVNFVNIDGKLQDPNADLGSKDDIGDDAV